MVVTNSARNWMIFEVIRLFRVKLLIRKNPCKYGSGHTHTRSDYIKTVPVGTVTAGKTNKDVTKALKDTEIFKNKPQRNCQDWTTDGLRDLKNEGIISQIDYNAAMQLLNPQKAPKTQAANTKAGVTSGNPSTPQGSGVRKSRCSVS